MAKRYPARLHVLSASQSRTAVVLRRGPSNAVCSVLWDRDRDQFSLGQWLRGRIYERRADISPDGRHMIYFARNGRWGRPPTRGSWTAISRVPWLKAVVLYGKGDCWQGGGLFTSNTRYWLNGACMHFPLQESPSLTQDSKYTPSGCYGGECTGVYYVRLQRDGWRLRYMLSAVRFDSCAVFEKELPHGWLLRKLAHEQVGAPPGRGCYWDEHELEHTKSGTRIEAPDWEWAELDGKTMVYAHGGCLYRAPIHEKGLGAPRMLYDFNAMEFEAIPAPY